MTDSSVACQRLLNQRIEGAKLATPEEVVRHLGAIQAQDYQQSLWAVGLRLLSATAADIERTISEGKVVATWPMRGTLHLVPSEDARWMLELSASRMLARDGRRMRQLGLDEEIMERCKELFHDALNGGRRLTRQDMMKLLEDAGISVEGQRGYHILWYLSQSGVICLGPRQDKQQTFVLLDEWVPDSRELTREESLAELARRYFTSHGPATVHDFARWAGLTVTESRSGIEAAAPELTSEKLNGSEHWTAANTPDHAGYAGSGVHLLPGFDEYLLGYKDRSAVLPPEHAHKIVPGNNGVFMPTILVCGQVAGIWKRKFNKDSLTVTLKPFTRLGNSEEAAIRAAEAYSNFVGLPLSSVEIEAGDPAF